MSPKVFGLNLADPGTVRARIAQERKSLAHGKEPGQFHSDLPALYYHSMVPRLCLAVLAVAASAAAQSKVEIDNAWVRVLRVNLAPHEKTPEHSIPTRSLFISRISTRVNGGGPPQGRRRRLASTRPKTPRRIFPISPVEYVLVELKPGAPKAKGWPVELDPVKLEPDHEQVPFENARVRVLRTILEPHLKGPTHDHPSYVVVYLTELHTTMTLADGKQVDNPRHPGEVAFRSAYRHTTENIGDRTAVGDPDRTQVNERASFNGLAGVLTSERMLRQC